MNIAHFVKCDVKDFENDFVDHFDKALLAKAKTEFQTYAFDLEHARKEEVQKFNQELKNGWWFSNKVGWFLYMRPPLAPEL